MKTEYEDVKADRTRLILISDITVKSCFIVSRDVSGWIEGEMYMEIQHPVSLSIYSYRIEILKNLNKVKFL